MRRVVAQHLLVRQISAHRRNERAAYTLIEVLVALTVLIAGFTALTTMTNRARQAGIAAEELSIAQLTCQTRVNELLTGVRPIAPSFDEPVAELDHWYMTTELFPATKPGLTTVRVQLSRKQQPGEAVGRHGGTSFFEITSWVDNTRLDSQIVQTLRQNPYAMTVAGMQQANMFGNNGMIGGMPGNMSGGMGITDMMAATGMGATPDMTGSSMFDMSGGMQTGMMSGGGLPMFDTTGAGDGIPPLSTPDDFVDTSPISIDRDNTSRMRPADISGVPAPLDVPSDLPSDFGPSTATSDSSATTPEDASGETSANISVENTDSLPDPEDDSDATSGTTTDESDDTETAAPTTADASTSEPTTEEEATP